jgi:hypothetical protein
MRMAPSGPGDHSDAVVGCGLRREGRPDGLGRGLMAQVEPVAISSSRVVAIITRDSAGNCSSRRRDAATSIVKATSMTIELSMRR